MRGQGCVQIAEADGAFQQLLFDRFVACVFNGVARRQGIGRQVCLERFFRTGWPRDIELHRFVGHAFPGHYPVNRTPVAGFSSEFRLHFSAVVAEGGHRSPELPAAAVHAAARFPAVDGPVAVAVLDTDGAANALGDPVGQPPDFDFHGGGPTRENEQQKPQQGRTRGRALDTTNHEVHAAPVWRSARGAGECL